VLRGEEVVAEEFGASGRSAAESLMPAVDAVLRRAALSLDKIDGFAVSIGPGSFTGLRVGLATVKGLAFGGARPVLPVSTLAALAAAVPDSGLPVVPVLDARRGEFYAAVYVPGRLLAEPILAEGVYTPGDLIEALPPLCVLVGEGVPLCGDEIARGLGVGVQRSDLRPAARYVGTLGSRLLARGGGVAPAEAAPRYLRRAEAEVKRTGERFEPSVGGS
jgi:tRNA threonylcarbamoyladenosine biosynthesis protein TsaB